MNAPVLGGRAVRIVVRNLRIAAGSNLEARRLADAIGPALERAFVGLRAGTPNGFPGRRRAPDRVAAQIAEAVAERLKGTA